MFLLSGEIMSPNEWGNLLISAVAVAVSTWVAVRNYRRTKLSEKQEAAKQSIADEIDHNANIAEQYNKLYNEYQEDRKESKREVEGLKQEVHNLSLRITDMQRSHEQDLRKLRDSFPGYRKYIHALRKQIHECGMEPLEWPEGLEQ